MRPLIAGVRTILGLDRPSASHRVTLVKMVGAVVWADGQCLDSELAEANAIVSELGGLPQDQCAQILQSTKEMTAELRDELANLPSDYAHNVLKIAYKIANADNEIHPAELAVIQEVASAVLPDSDWADVQAWIEAYDALLKATQKLYA